MLVKSTDRTKRVFASIIDGIVLSMITLLLAFMILEPFGLYKDLLVTFYEAPEEYAMAPIGILYSDVISIILSLSYLTILPMMWLAQTVGRKVFKFRLYRMNENGSIAKATWGDYVLREIVINVFLNIVTLGLFGLISLIVSLCREDKRCLHDVWSKTIFLDNVFVDDFELLTKSAEELKSI